MAVVTIEGPDPNISTPVLVVPATAVPTAAPTAGSDRIHVGKYGRIRTFLDYTGTVTACTLKIWFRDLGAGGNWYEGATTDDLDPLTPGGASPVDEARDWDVGQGNEVSFQVTAIAGGGSVAVRVQGVRS